VAAADRAARPGSDGASPRAPQARVVYVSGDEREAVPTLAPVIPTETAPEAAAVERTIRGRVFDADGAALAGVPVALEGREDAPAVSGGGGCFELRTSQGSARLVGASRPGWATVREGVWAANDAVHPVVVMAPTLELAGEVIDEAGWSLAGARLSFDLPERQRRRAEADAGAPGGAGRGRARRARDRRRGTSGAAGARSARSDVDPDRHGRRLS
jgi:hypothetical protein